VVMPPGHGKSIHHGSGWLKNASVLCDRNGSGELARLEYEACNDLEKLPQCVEEWASILKTLAVPGDVVMVPDTDVAYAAGFRVLGVLLLDKDVWVANLVGKSGESAVRAQLWLRYESVMRARNLALYMCISNDVLTDRLRALCVLAKTGLLPKGDSGSSYVIDTSAGALVLPAGAAVRWASVSADGWFDTGLRDCRFGTTPADGYCYTQVMKPSWVEKAKADLSLWPTFGELIQYHSVAYDMQACKEALLVNVGDGKFHVLKTDTCLAMGDSFYNCVARRVGAMATPPPAVSLGGFVGAACVPRLGVSPDFGDEFGGTSGLGPYLARLSGVPDHVFDPTDLVIVSSSAALLGPVHKRRLKMLEALGDSVLSSDIALRCLREGRTAEEYQNARSVVTSNPSLSRLYAENVPAGMVTFASGVDPGKGKVGAYVIEAWLGLVYNELGADALSAVCSAIGVYSQYTW